jgi:hypothetical protein
MTAGAILIDVAKTRLEPPRKRKTVVKPPRRTVRGSLDPKQRLMSEVSKLKAADVPIVLEIVSLVRNRKTQCEPLGLRGNDAGEHVLAAIFGPTKTIGNETDEANLQAAFDWRSGVLKGALKTPQVMHMLNLASREAVKQRIRRKELLAVKDGRDYVYPPWQFDARTESRMVKGLQIVLRAMTVDPIMIAAWLSRPNRGLDDSSPIDALKSGRLV